MAVQSPVNLVLTTTEGVNRMEMINVRFYINWKYSYNTNQVRVAQKIINLEIINFGER